MSWYRFSQVYGLGNHIPNIEGSSGGALALSSSLENKYIQKLQNIHRNFKRDVTDQKTERERESGGGVGGIK